MPWKAVPFSQETYRALSGRFNVRGIPTFIILAPDGSIVTNEGRAKIMREPNVRILIFYFFSFIQLR